ncbi:hypothetical protein [Tropicibacter naphthalenivorans]|uniref:Uncharacterized protein n=1 Tax=Tropicibacter naphthalenivorans TaxID=441103 RepID=A0A0N7LZ27_9RHOB|nr:hypothetical protein [Tropicibacter naphthalenivorans]CUH76497.1 hypothetical protein TRN7648_00966 [Tropicibacter naphthalenivorans]SMC65771.1 hypothetical protein SAMN04488093_102652 [Tropicibacter naphthalenivorans]
MATETTPEAEQAPKKRARAAATANIALPLDPQVRTRLTRLAKAEGMTLGHYLQKVLELHLLETAEEGDLLAQRLKAKREVIDHVVALAQMLDKDGKFDEHFVLTVMKTASEDEEFMELYKTVTGEEGRKAARLQQTLNQQLGRLIRKAANAGSKRNEEGRAIRAQVTGEIITSYSLLERKEAESE